MSLCGDGVLDPDEQCDDGANNGDTQLCKSDCTDQACGDGFVGAGEGCDDGNVQGGDGCSAACVSESCGDGVVDGGEACDDGENGDPDDGCTDLCTLPVCGDALVQPSLGEGCDAGVDNSDQGICTLACKAAFCGDGLVWTGEEACDDGVNDGGYGGCAADCQSLSPYCGDAVKNGPEACDDGVNDGGYSGCAVDCQSLPPYCGDAVKNGPEACDDGVNDGGYDGCAVDCEQLGPYCGDMVKNGPEGCDDGDQDNTDGCLTGCTIPTTCLDIKTKLPAAADGLYVVVPPGFPAVTVWCDMTSNGGGYTMLKLEFPVMMHAVTAEAECDKYGMNLFIPRTPAHILSAWTVATDPNVGPDASDLYLRLMGIYPKFPGAMCSFKALKSTTPGCDWRAKDSGPFFVSNLMMISEPSGDNLLGHSMGYYFNMMGNVVYYNDGNSDYKTDRIMCDFSDKQM